MFNCMQLANCWKRSTTAGHEWDTDLLATLKILPVDELRPHLLEKFGESALRDAIALILAESPTEDTRAHPRRDALERAAKRRPRFGSGTFATERQIDAG